MAELANRFYFIMLADRYCQSLMGCPAKNQTSGNYLMTYSQAPPPISKCMRLAIVFDKMVSSRILSLQAMRNPFTIIRLITKVVVHALNGISLRALAHVREKISGRFSPSLANSYTSTAIIFIAGMVGIATTSIHAYPDSKIRMLAQAMLFMKRTVHANATAAAASISAISKVSFRINTGFTASAFA